ncbi:MAG TPA: RNase adapter RapZ [Abditibacteriaceae bacterium]|jgi:UPF0042 nucleotide-binding protein|nr:RNase adapter RapZ [Abditibacteriaceae bacterium]
MSSSFSSLQFILITGLSGAGKGLATAYFEDFGFRCVDNLPPALIPVFAEWCVRNDIERAAVVADVRSAPRLGDHYIFVDELQSALKTLRSQGIQPQVLFLETDDDRLIQRFKETRRKHPLSDEVGDLNNAIATEREALIPLRERADKIVNTSHVTPRELRQTIEKTFVADANGDKGSAQMLVQIESFGFKHGAPSDADLVFDVRFLPNPNYDPQIGHLSGNDQPVIDYVLREPLTQQYQNHLRDFLGFCLPQFEREGKAYLSIAVGCTGGRHRSVVLSNWLSAHLREQGFRTGISHRDVARPRASKTPPNNDLTSTQAVGEISDNGTANAGISDVDSHSAEIVPERDL